MHHCVAVRGRFCFTPSVIKMIMSSSYNADVLLTSLIVMYGYQFLLRLLYFLLGFNIGSADPAQQFWINNSIFCGSFSVAPAQRLMLSDSCSMVHAQRLMLSGSCSMAHTQRLMLSSSCSVAPAQQHMLRGSCSVLD